MPEFKRAVFDWRFVVTLVVVFGLGWLLYAQIGALRDRAERSAQDRADLHSKVETQQTLIDELTRRCQQADGCTPPPVPEAIRGERGDPGLQGPVGPQGPRGASCVEELGYPKCRGAEGNAGQVGATGATGEPGVDGAPGKNGADGKDGPPGPQGEPGPAGPQGPAGTALPGNYACPDGQYLNGFAISGDGSVSLSCQSVPIDLGGKQ